MSKWKKLDKEQFSQAADMYRAGLSIADVAELFSVSKQNIYALFLRHGIKKRMWVGDVLPENRWAFEEYRKRCRAYNAVAKAVAKGVLVRQPCEVCGEGNVEAHHDDYDKPLTVRWLCRPHHEEWHKIHGKKYYTGIVKFEEEGWEAK